MVEGNWIGEFYEFKFYYKFDIPLNYLDVSSRNVTLEYIIGGAFYIIKYTVEGEPYADFDFEIPGVRGKPIEQDTISPEGVDNETLKLAKEARSKANLSMISG